MSKEPGLGIYHIISILLKATYSLAKDRLLQ